MITELLGLAGSGILGSAFGMISDTLQAKRENALLQTKLRLAQEARLNGQVQDHLNVSTGFVASNSFAFAFLCLTVTYCSCAILCFMFPDVPLQTFNPDDGKTSLSLFWGFFQWNIQTTHVYTITTGGVGYALLHPLAFQIGSVITGINPMSRSSFQT